MLRPYQSAALDKCKERYQAGVNRQLLVMATGLGKAVIFATLRQHMEWDKRVMVLVHREELAAQAADKLLHWNPGLMVGVEMARSKARGMDTHVVASVPTLGRKNSERLKQFDPAAFDCIVSDECFPAGTLVDGRPIENIVAGDSVLSYDESSGTHCRRRVLSTFKNPSPGRMVVVTCGDVKLTCTESHPIYTRKGWKHASSLERHDRLLLVLPPSGRFVHTSAVATYNVPEDGESVLLECLSRPVHFPFIFREDGENQPEICVSTDDRAEPDAPGRQSSAHEEHPLGDGSQTSNPWWKRDWPYPFPVPTTFVPWYGMDGRARSQDGTLEGERLPDGLQTRPGARGAQDRRGGGRELAWTACETGAGRQEGSTLAWVGVDSVEIQEQGSAGEPDRMCPDGYVYNLEVEGTHTYFANGVLVHNCHHACSPQWARVLDYFGLMQPGGPILSLGLTATPNRSDGIGLRRCFDEIVYDMGIDAGIREGYLVDLRCWRISTKTTLDDVRTVAGDFNEGDLAKTVNTPERNGMIVKAWAQHAKDKKSLVFTANIQHALDLAEAFKALGVPTAAVWGDDPDRSEKLRKHRAGVELLVLCNCAVLTEGYDDPNIEVIVLARPTKSALLLTQMIGRGTRMPDGCQHISDVGDGKKDCIILDVVDTTSKHQLCTVPSLLGLPVNIDLRGKTYQEAKQRIERVAAEFPTANLADLRDLEKLDYLAQQVSLFTVKYPPEVERLTELAWRKQGDGYVLPVMRERLTLCRDLRDEWWVRGSLNGTPVEIHAQNLAGAFNAADREVMASGDRKPLVMRNARWHDQSPSKKQIELCRKVRLQIPAGATRGMVSAALDAHFGRL